MVKNHLSNKELSVYLSGAAQETSRAQAERHLKTCGDCFQKYMQMREAIFLQKGGEAIPLALKQKVIERIRQNGQSHVAIIVRFLKDKVVVFSGDQGSLRFQGLRANFAYRDGDALTMSRSEEGPISITRTIDGREVTITIYPLANKEKISLGLAIKPAESLEATISFDGERVETIADVSKQSMVRTELPRQGELDIHFAKKKSTVFTIALNLETGE